MFAKIVMQIKEKDRKSMASKTRKMIFNRPLDTFKAIYFLVTFVREHLWKKPKRVDRRTTEYNGMLWPYQLLECTEKLLFL